MSVEPLSPAEVDALLGADDRRTLAADLRVLRDALLRLSDAWAQLAESAAALERQAGGGLAAETPGDQPVSRSLPSRRAS